MQLVYTPCCQCVCIAGHSGHVSQVYSNHFLECGKPNRTTTTTKKRKRKGGWNVKGEQTKKMSVMRFWCSSYELNGCWMASSCRMSIKIFFSFFFFRLIRDALRYVTWSRSNTRNLSGRWSFSMRQKNTKQENPIFFFFFTGIAYLKRLARYRRWLHSNLLVLVLCSFCFPPTPYFKIFLFRQENSKQTTKINNKIRQRLNVKRQEEMP